MPIGIIINSIVIILGGIIGGLLGHLATERIKYELNGVFGICAIAMGIPSITQMANMPAVILAVVVGTTLGLVFHFGQQIEKVAALMQRPIGKIFPHENLAISHDEFINSLVTAIVLFCASGTGIYGSLTAGMTGDHTILIAKSVLDFFTAVIFASNLGYVVSVIALPQFVIFFSLFLFAGIIFPMTTPEMILDFKACGGFLMLATGFRMSKIRMFPTADMIPAMILVMPISWVWLTYVLPFLQ